LYICIFHDRFVLFVALSVHFSVWVCCTKKNLVTLTFFPIRRLAHHQELQLGGDGSAELQDDKLHRPDHGFAGHAERFVSLNRPSVDWVESGIFAGTDVMILQNIFLPKNFAKILAVLGC
jgi:hypothetical protein